MQLQVKLVQADLQRCLERLRVLFVLKTDDEVVGVALAAATDGATFSRPPTPATFALDRQRQARDYGRWS
jgi:hypothetical protein